MIDIANAINSFNASNTSHLLKINDTYAQNAFTSSFLGGSKTKSKAKPETKPKVQIKKQN